MNDADSVDAAAVSVSASASASTSTSTSVSVSMSSPSISASMTSNVAAAAAAAVGDYSTVDAAVDAASSLFPSPSPSPSLSHLPVSASSSASASASASSFHGRMFSLDRQPQFYQLPNSPSPTPAPFPSPTILDMDPTNPTSTSTSTLTRPDHAIQQRQTQTQLTIYTEEAKSGREEGGTSEEEYFSSTCSSGASSGHSFHSSSHSSFPSHSNIIHLLPESHPLEHSYSQPELYRSSLTPLSHVHTRLTSVDTIDEQTDGEEKMRTEEEEEQYPLISMEQQSTDLMSGELNAFIHSSTQHQLSPPPLMTLTMTSHVDDMDNQRDQSNSWKQDDSQTNNADQTISTVKKENEKQIDFNTNNSSISNQTHEDLSSSSIQPLVTSRDAQSTAKSGNSSDEKEEKNEDEEDDESEDDDDEDDLPPLTVLELISLCLPAAAVTIGWAVGEALLLPYLLSLGVSPTVANLAFLANPLLGLFLQPFFGRLSDQSTLAMGRRRPFLLLFCMGSVSGLSMIVWSIELAHMFGSVEGGLFQLLLIFIGFGLMDLSHDLLLMPARALLNDRLPDEQTDQGNAYFAAISSVGSCIGLTLTIIPLEQLQPWSFLPHVSPVRATFITAMLLIFMCNMTTIWMSAGLDKGQ